MHVYLHMQQLKKKIELDAEMNICLCIIGCSVYWYISVLVPVEVTSFYCHQTVICENNPFHTSQYNTIQLQKSRQLFPVEQIRYEETITHANTHKHTDQYVMLMTFVRLD